MFRLQVIGLAGCVLAFAYLGSPTGRFQLGGTITTYDFVGLEGVWQGTQASLAAKRDSLVTWFYSADSVVTATTLEPLCFLDSPTENVLLMFAFEPPAPSLDDHCIDVDTTSCTQEESTLVACPRGAHCTGGVIEQCFGKHFQVASTRDACLLTAQANATIGALQQQLEVWTVMVQDQDYCFGGTCPQDVASAVVDRNVDDGRLLFDYGTLVQTVHVAYDAKLVEHANAAAPVDKQVFVTGQADDKFLIGLHPDQPIPIQPGATVYRLGLFAEHVRFRASMRLDAVWDWLHENIFEPYPVISSCVIFLIVGYLYSYLALYTFILYRLFLALYTFISVLFTFILSLPVYMFLIVCFLIAGFVYIVYTKCARGIAELRPTTVAEAEDRKMNAVLTVTTRLRDSPRLVNYPLPTWYGVEYMVSTAVVMALQSPFSWTDLLSFLSRQQRIVWLNTEVFLVIGTFSPDYEFDGWAGLRGYARLLVLGLSTEEGDYIRIYASTDRQPVQTTAVIHFLVDLFCLGEGNSDTAYLGGDGIDSVAVALFVDAALLRFLSRREDIASLRNLELFHVLLSEVICRALETFSEAADSRLEIHHQQCHVPSNVGDGDGDAFISYLRQNRVRKLHSCTLPVQVLSRGLRATTSLRAVTLRLSSLSEDSMTPLAQGLTANEGLEVLQLIEDTGGLAKSEACLRILCEALATHTTLTKMILTNFFNTGRGTFHLSVQDKDRRARYLQQLLTSNTGLMDVSLSDYEMAEPFWEESIRPFLEINRFRARFVSVRNDPLLAKLLAHALAKLAEYDDADLISLFLTVNREALVIAVLHVADEWD